ncbi:basic proline-rich protein-like [Ovis aries]|uniref:basic proline-rich protein-like n=1 Tax=Ovis aries TaxID=9940 RepID=UPI00295288DB|nr:basic proline-rich protein-like [Ovis aries]
MTIAPEEERPRAARNPRGPCRGRSRAGKCHVPCCDRQAGGRAGSVARGGGARVQPWPPAPSRASRGTAAAPGRRAEAPPPRQGRRAPLGTWPREVGQPPPQPRRAARATRYCFIYLFPPPGCVLLPRLPPRPPSSSAPGSVRPAPALRLRRGEAARGWRGLRRPGLRAGRGRGDGAREPGGRGRRGPRAGGEGTEAEAARGGPCGAFPPAGRLGRRGRSRHGYLPAPAEPRRPGTPRPPPPGRLEGSAPARRPPPCRLSSSPRARPNPSGTLQRATTAQPGRREMAFFFFSK